MELIKISLKQGKDKSIERKHPWIFSGAIKAIDGEVADGDLVEVVTANGRRLGVGHYQNGSIMVRVLLFSDEALTENLYEQKIESAFRLRKSLGFVDAKDTTIFRLVHAEGFTRLNHRSL